MDYLARLEWESDAAYKLRLQCALQSERPLSFDEAIEFLRDFGLVADTATMAEAEKAVEELNRGRTWDRYNSIIFAIENVTA